MERKNAWKEYTEAEVSELEKLNESYKRLRWRKQLDTLT